MVKEKYLLAAKNLTVMNKNEFNSNRSYEERAIDYLFYQIMSAIDYSIAYRRRETTRRVTVKKYFNDRKGTCMTYMWLTDKNEMETDFWKSCDDFSSRRKFDSELFKMKEVSKLFNELGENKKVGYHFSANYTVDDDYEVACLTVTMCTE